MEIKYTDSASYPPSDFLMRGGSFEPLLIGPVWPEYHLHFLSFIQIITSNVQAPHPTQVHALQTAGVNDCIVSRQTVNGLGGWVIPGDSVTANIVLPGFMPEPFEEEGSSFPSADISCWLWWHSKDKGCLELRPALGTGLRDDEGTGL